MKYFVRLLSLLLALPLSALAVDVQISQLTEDVGFDPATRSGKIVYIAKVINGSADTAQNTLLVFPIPATTTFDSVDDGRCAHDNSVPPGQINCTLGNLVGNGLGGPTTTIKFTIVTSAATGATVDVSATITADTDTNTAAVGGNNNYESQNTTIADGADLVTTINDTGAVITAGANVTYTVSIENQGPNASATTTVTNTLPADVTFGSASGAGWSCSNALQVVTCIRSSIANGATAPNITIVGKVTGAVAGAGIGVTGTITDSVTVSSTTGDPNPNNNTQTEDTDVVAGADLSIVKSVNPDPVTGAATATFTFQPRNNGPFDVVDAVVTDTFPAGFSAIIVTNLGGWTCGVIGQTVSCTLASFIVGNTNNITVTATAPASGMFDNTVTISNTSGMPDPTPANNSSTISNVDIVPDGADLAITKSKTPNPVAQGSNMVSTIRVTNNGPQATTGTLTVTETLNGETYVAPITGAGWSCSVAGVSPSEVLTCEYSATPLASGSSTSNLLITTTATNAGALSNTASVTDVGGTEDPSVLGDNTVTVPVDSTAQIADLAITKAATTANLDSVLALLEDTITYTLTLTNNGPNDLTDPLGGGVQDAIVITDTVPRYVSGVPGPGPTATGVTMTSVNADFTCTTGATVTCKLNDGTTFANGASETFTFTVTRPFASGDHVNTARVTSAILGDDNPGNNTSNPTTITVAAPADVADVEVTTKIVTPGTVKAGVNTTYVISLKNNGPAAALDVKLKDVFAAPSLAGKTFTVISINANGAGASCDTFEQTTANTLDCSFGTLARNAIRSVTMVIRPDWDGANLGWTMANTATVSTTSAQGIDPAAVTAAEANDSQTATLTVTPAQIDLLVNNDEEAGFHQVGYTPAPGAFPATTDNIIVYKQVINNRGPSLATGVNLGFDMTPKATKTLTFLCDDTGATSCTAGGGNATCNNEGVAITGGATLNLACPQADMAANTTLTRYLFFRVNTPPDGTGDTHTTLATVSANETDSVPANDTEAEDTVVRALVDVGVTKDPSKPIVSVFEPFDWDLVISSNGPGNAPFTDLTDTLPAGMELTGPPIPSAGSCTGLSGETSFECNFGTLENSDTRTVTVPVRLTVFPVGGTITNTAFVTTFGIDRDPTNDSDPGTVTVQKSSITGTVYSDFDDDGIQNGVESGILNVSLRLTGTDLYGNAVDTTVTSNANGEYLFDDLAPSGVAGYTITETQPANFTDGLESVLDVVKAGSRSSDQHTSISLAVNAALIEYDFGEIPQPGISGLVWGDTNNDGVLDATETARISGVTITLTGTDNLGDPVNRVLTTDANGQYNFINLLPSNGAGYTVTETHPTAWRDGQEALGTVNGVPTGTAAADSFTGIVLLLDQAGVDYNFGEIGGSLAGKVYRDLNDDGVVDAGEAGIENVRLTLTGTDSNAQSITRITTTDANGDYIFTSLPASDGTGYTVTETQPAGIFDGKDTDGSLANGDVSVNDINSSIEFLNTDVVTDYNFGEGGNIPPPETPLIGLAKSLAAISNNGDGTYDVTFNFVVENAGGTALEAIQVVDDLTAQFGSYTAGIPAENEYTIVSTPLIVSSTNSASLTASATFTGAGSNKGLLDPAGSLLPNFGDSASTALIQFTLRFFPTSSGPFNNAAVVTGVDPRDGKEVTDDSVDGVDPDPTSDDDPTNDTSPTPVVLPSDTQSIGIAKRVSGSIVQLDSKRYQVPYSLVVTNINEDTTATNVQVSDNLITTFPTAETITISSPAVVSGCTGTVLNVASSAFTGTGQNNLLVGNQNLLVGESCTISFTAEVDFGSNVVPTVVQNNQAVATTAQTPGGVVIATDLSDDGVDVDPNDNHNANEAGENDPTPVSFGQEIGVAKRVSGSIVQLDSKRYQVPYSLTVTNVDLVTIATNVQVSDTLTTTFPMAQTITISSPAVVVDCTGTVLNIANPAFTGIGQNNLLAGDQNLLAGESCSINFTVEVDFGTNELPTVVQNNQALATTTQTPGGTVVIATDLSDDGVTADPNGNNKASDVGENDPTPVIFTPTLENSLVVTKITPKNNVVRGELVPYTIQVGNTLASVVNNFAMQDQVPAGFKYVDDSATIDGVKVEPIINGRNLMWPGQNLAANGELTIQLILIVGAGVSEGEYINQAWAVSSVGGAIISNVAAATVRLVPDPLFDCSDIIGKVFDDKNINGYQDESELGLAGVRVVTPRGLLVTTDDYGRFHVACADVPNELHGSNFLMKLDTRTLPSGYRVTTENPRVVRLTRGKLVKLNFGAALHRVIRVDIESKAFSDDGEMLTSVAITQLDQLIDILKQQPSQVRLSYNLAANEDKADAQARMQVFTEQLETLWQQCDCDNYALTIEQEVITQEGDTNVWSSTGRVTP